MRFVETKEEHKNERINSILGLVHLGDYERAIDLLVIQIIEDAHESGKREGAEHQHNLDKVYIEALEAQLSKKKTKKGKK